MKMYLSHVTIAEVLCERRPAGTDVDARIDWNELVHDFEQLLPKGTRTEFTVLCGLADPCACGEP